MLDVVDAEIVVNEGCCAEGYFGLEVSVECRLPAGPFPRCPRLRDLQVRNIAGGMERREIIRYGLVVSSSVVNVQYYRLESQR